MSARRDGPPRWARPLALCLAAYLALGAWATARRELEVRNAFDEMLLEGPRTERGWPFPWLPGGKDLPASFRMKGRSGVDPDPGYSAYSYAGDVGRPWEGMEYAGDGRAAAGGAGLTVGDGGTLSGWCGTGDGTTGGGTGFYAHIRWRYDAATGTLSTDGLYVLAPPGGDSVEVPRAEWLAATGVDGEALDAWADGALSLALAGWVEENAGSGGRFSRDDLGEVTVAVGGDEVALSHAGLDELLALLREARHAAG